VNRYKDVHKRLTLCQMKFLNNVYGVDQPKTRKPSLVSKLERNGQELVHLRRLLNSHVCEPRTPGLFERAQILKSGLERLCKKNMEIMCSLYPKGQSCADFVERSEEQFSESEELRKGVKEYFRVIDAD